MDGDVSSPISAVARERLAIIAAHKKTPRGCAAFFR
jgi:hypothetical protein